MKSLIILVVTSLLFATTSTAQLYVKNNSDVPISIAIGWYQNGDSWSGFITKGWYNIEPGEKVGPLLYFKSTEERFYYYAKSTDGKLVWEGKSGLLTSKQSFTIQNADKQYVKDRQPEYQWKNFRKVDISFGVLETKTYVLNLNGSPKFANNNNRSDSLLAIERNKRIEDSIAAIERKKYRANFVGEYIWPGSANGFSASITIKSIGPNKYSVQYEGAKSGGCVALFDGTGNYLNGKLVAIQDNCTLTFTLTSDGNLTLVSSSGGCSDIHGATCSFYSGIYLKK